MSRVQLRILDLRKRNQIGQKELAEQIGVSVQTVSKWENEICMPDISLLPEIAEFFQVSVDEVLGLKPLPGEKYIPVRSGEKDYWDSRLNYLKVSRKSFWNDDYLQFLVEKVWKIDKPVQILDCGCGFGYMGQMLLPHLPEGSGYTGIDFSRNMVEEGKRLFGELGMRGEFICDDFRTYRFNCQYDFVISQAALRHAGNAKAFLQKMISQAKSGGLVAAVDVNREFEYDGFYIDGMDYQELCSRGGFRKMWSKELACQDRDYAVGMRLPVMMQKEGLADVQRGGRRTHYPAVYKPRHGPERGGRLLPEAAENTGICGKEQRKPDVSAMAGAGHQLWVESLKVIRQKCEEEME